MQNVNKFICTDCNNIYSEEDNSLGTELFCPDCGGKLEVYCSEDSEEQSRCNNTEKKSFHEGVSNNLSSPIETIQYLKNDLGTEYEILQKKNRILISKNFAIGCAIRFNSNENGAIIYESPSAYYSFWFFLIVAIPLVTLFLIIFSFYKPGGQYLGILPIIIILLILRIVSGVLVKIPSKGFIQRVKQIMKTKYEAETCNQR